MKKMNALDRKLIMHTTIGTLCWAGITLFLVVLGSVALGGFDEANIAKATFGAVLIQVFLLNCYELYLHDKPCKKKQQYHIAIYKVSIFALSPFAATFVALSEPLSLDMTLVVACITALISADRVVNNNEKVLKLKKALLENEKKT